MPNKCSQLINLPFPPVNSIPSCQSGHVPSFNFAKLIGLTNGRGTREKKRTWEKEEETRKEVENGNGWKTFDSSFALVRLFTLDPKGEEWLRDGATGVGVNRRG